MIAPAASREPRQASPNRDPSSSTNTDTPIGRAGTTPRDRSSSIAASADTTPSGPSYAPPSSTESRCDPVSTPRPGAGPPPGDEVAGVVGLDGQVAGGGLLRNQSASSRSGWVNGWRK